MVFPPHLVVPIPSAVVNAATREMHLATAAQHLGAVGLAALLYDHSLTFADEINLIYTAPRSFMKWVFLTNHYLVEVCLIAIANDCQKCRDLVALCVMTNCQKFITAVACCSTMSTFVSNFLGFLRVITLWDKSHRVMLGLGIVLTMSFLTTMGCTVVPLIFFEPAIRYDPSLKLCYAPNTSNLYLVLWATPLVFDIIMVAFIVYNSLSNPRDLKTSLRRVLYRDGILFFLFVALIRALNLVFVIVAEPGLAAFPAYLSWAMTSLSWAVITLSCRRLLIHVHSCEQKAACYDDLYASRHSPMETDSVSAIELHICKTNCH